MDELDVYECAYVLTKILLNTNDKGIFKFESFRESFGSNINEDSIKNYLVDLDTKGYLSFNAYYWDGVPEYYYIDTTDKTKSYYIDYILSTLKESKQKVFDLKIEHEQEVAKIKDECKQEIIKAKDDYEQEAVEIKDGYEQKLLRLSSELTDLIGYDPKQLENQIRSANNIVHDLKTKIMVNEMLSSLAGPVDEMVAYISQIEEIHRDYVGIYKNITKPIVEEGKAGTKATALWAIISIVISTIISIIITNWNNIK